MVTIKPDSIDWNKLWKKARAEKNYRSKTPADWDRKAASFARRNTNSLYAEQFIKLLRPHKTWSVLDIGCGPGTLALPLAKRVKNLTGLDFSPKMLAILNRQAAAQNSTNISTFTLSWDDNWEEQGIEPHDVVLASRALAVDDLETSLRKMNRFARKSVAVTDRVGPGPFDPAAFSAIGRELKPGPDYIYTVNLLYQMGIQASVQFIRHEDTLECDSMREAMDMYTWMFHDLKTREKKELKKYLQSITTRTATGSFIIHREHVPTWAFIRWHP